MHIVPVGWTWLKFKGILTQNNAKETSRCKHGVFAKVQSSGKLVGYVMKYKSFQAQNWELFSTLLVKFVENSNKKSVFS